MPVPLGGKLELCGDLVCRGRAICLVEKIRRAFRSGFCVWGKNVCLCGWGRLFMHEKRLLYSIDLLGRGAGKWGKNAPTLSYPPSRIPKTEKIEL